FKHLLNSDVQPNVAHYALTDMEKAGKLNAVITQNVDGLHQKAGSKNVLELHGTIAVHRCHHCRLEYPTDEVIALGGKVPYCRMCGGAVRPDAVFYGETLNETVVNLAVGAISAADMLIIGGASLAVYPASAYLQYFRGRKIVLINKGETAYDSRADIVFRDSIGEVLRRTICK
ncbi:MAG TPA: NAD-dependent protein deacylase, partial [Ruminococcaceae bacterium]|nr:NAD-dependent protein deacylase [Oscillospiraceae bacterium]